jgi:hypothetical protein
MSLKIKTLVSFSVAILSCIPPSNAQADLKEITLKLYTNFLYSDTETSGIYNTIIRSSTTEKNKTIQSGYFSPSISFSLPNGNNHEIELSRLMFNRDNNETVLEDDTTGQSGPMVAGSLDTEFLIAFRYEYNIVMLKKKADLKLRPTVGFSADPFFSITSSKPYISLSYPTKETRAGLSLSVIPRLIYNLGENWFLDLNFPVSLLDMYYSRGNIDRPDLPLDSRSTATIEIHELPNRFQVRFGVGLRL